jgi:hypothetical protein
VKSNVFMVRLLVAMSAWTALLLLSIGLMRL